MKRASLIVALVFMAASLVAGTAAGKEEKAPDGKPIFLKYKCASCHAIQTQGITKKVAAGEAGEGAEGAGKAAEGGETAKSTEGGAAPESSAAGAAIGSKAPDLGGVGLVRTATWMSNVLQKKEKIGTKLHIKKFRGTDEELAQLTGWLATLKDEAAAKKLKVTEPAKPESK